MLCFVIDEIGKGRDHRRVTVLLRVCSSSPRSEWNVSNDSLKNRKRNTSFFVIYSFRFLNHATNLNVSDSTQK